MAALLKWKEPRAVVEYEFRHEGITEFKNLFRLFWKWSFILGLPAIAAVWYWSPKDASRVVDMLIVCCTAVPALLVGAVWVDSKVGNQCVINKKGMIRIFGTKGTLYPWKEIETYRFVNYPHVPNVRDLIIVVHQRNRQFERHLRFYPHEVDEKELEELLRKYLFRNH